MILRALFRIKFTASFFAGGFVAIAFLLSLLISRTNWDHLELGIILLLLIVLMFLDLFIEELGELREEERYSVTQQVDRNFGKYNSPLIRMIKKYHLKSGKKPRGWLYYECEGEIYPKPFYGSKKQAEEIKEIVKKIAIKNGFKRTGLHLDRRSILKTRS